MWMAAQGHRAGFSLKGFVEQHQLPAAFTTTADQYFVPLAEWLHQRISDHRGFVLGINGAQGAGKSTLAAFLGDYLPAQYDYSVAALSIDDLYLRKADRDALGRSVHPLLATRGVPGTHDVDLGLATIRKLQRLGEHESCPLPRFDKLQDDRVPEDDWPTAGGPVDVILFDGWCVGSQPVSQQALIEPVNELEQTRDAGGEWRQFVNHQLAEPYQALFALLDALVFMAVPDIACVRRWRAEQEHQLVAAAPGAQGQGMTDTEVAEFVQYFERITLNNLAVLPERADVVLQLGSDHQVVSARYRDA